MRMLMIGDMHYGEQGNSQHFNNQTNELIDWICDEFGDKVDKVVQMGDWFHHRDRVQVDTLGYAIVGAKKLAETFGKENVYVLAGNHDLYYLDRLDVSSLAAIDPYVTVVDELQPIDSNVLLTPWIASDQMWGDVVEASEKYEYCLGHFEFNGFKMNDAYEMKSGHSHRELHGYTRVISGHYHTYQEKDNVVYLGTPLPITFSEANQEHGVFVLDTETDSLEFFHYDAVKVISIPYDKIDTLKGLDINNTRVRLEFPSDLEDEGVIGEMMTQLGEMGFTGSRSQYKGQKLERLLDNSVEVTDIEDIDANIRRAIEEIDTEGIDTVLLSDIYSEVLELSNE